MEEKEEEVSKGYLSSEEPDEDEASSSACLLSEPFPALQEPKGE
jgi:hypothetical protein